MIVNWDELIEIFKNDDGSLPDIELNNLSDKEIISGYEKFRKHAGVITSENAHFWSLSEQSEIPIMINDNPSRLVVSGKAEPFHLCFGKIKSPKGKKIPELGLFVFSDSLALDYRMGAEWNEEALEGLFELILAISMNFKNFEINHKSNISDPDGLIFKSHWKAYIDSQVHS